MLQFVRKIQFTHQLHPRYFRVVILSVFLVIFILTASNVVAADASIHSEASYKGTPTPQQESILNEVNILRTDHHLPPFKLNTRLNDAALQKSQDMQKFDYWAHTNLHTHKTPWQFIQQTGYTYKTAGENLAYDFSTDKKMVDAWMKSPSSSFSELYKTADIVLYEAKRQKSRFLTVFDKRMSRYRIAKRLLAPQTS